MWRIYTLNVYEWIQIFVKSDIILKMENEIWFWGAGSLITQLGKYYSHVLNIAGKKNYFKKLVTQCAKFAVAQ